MSEKAFQVRLSREAGKIYSFVARMKPPDQFGTKFGADLMARLAAPFVHSISDIICTGAVRLHCSPDVIDALQSKLPKTLAGTIDSTDWKDAFDINESKAYIEKSCPSIRPVHSDGPPKGGLISDTALKLSMFLSDLAAAS